jgi:hypothetical protein
MFAAIMARIGSRLPCLRSFEGRRQKLSAINLKLAGWCIASSVCVHDEEQSGKKAQPSDSGEKVKN